MNSISKDLESYQKNGFLLIPSFFDLKTLDSIRSESKKVFVSQMLQAGLQVSESMTENDFEQALYHYFKQDLQGFIYTSKTCQYLLSLHRLAVAENVVEQIQNLGLRHPSLCTRPFLSMDSPYLAKSESYYKTPAHQDWRSMQGSLNAIVLWIPLVDVDKSLGALEVIPESHLRGLETTKPDEWYRELSESPQDDQFASIEIKKGDALFFSAFLIHRSGINNSNSIRWSSHFRYNDLAEPTFIDRQYPNPYTYKPQQALITPDFPSVQHLTQVFQQDEP